MSATAIFAFAIDRVHAHAPQHPAWKTEEPHASLVIRHDVSPHVEKAPPYRGLADVVQDAFDHLLVEDEGEDGHRLAAAGASRNIRAGTRLIASRPLQLSL